MEPLEIRSVPARMGALSIVLVVLFAGIGGVVLERLLEVLTAVADDLDRDVGSFVGFTVLVLLFGVLLWWYLRTLLPQAFLIGRYLTRDRGKRVLTFRLEEAGWRWLQGGSDVLLPWEGMTVEIVNRSENLIHLRMVVAGEIIADRDPVSIALRRSMRRNPKIDIPFTRVDPTEDELVAAIERLSGGRVIVTR